ncbi:hypothetical protein R4Z09_26190 [Niallia oryzisoli]|uniref:Peptidase M48 domain-containing protein n=1 Tax=Niallia oryzisoli TaxID=1737571 RepID=A0ABZ2CCC4_9BACI
MRLESRFEPFIKLHSHNLETYTYDSERLEEYERIFGESFKEKGFLGETEDGTKGISVPYNKIQEIKIKMYESILDRIFLYGPAVIGPHRQSFRIRPVLNWKDNTKGYKVEDKVIILVDTNTKAFNYRMNKLFLYGEELTNKEKIHMASSIFLHFIGFIKSEENSFIYQKPKALRHPNLHFAKLLQIFDEIQLTFIIAHEIAHYLIDNIQEYKEMLDNMTIPNSNTLVNLEDNKILEEVLADSIAFDLTKRVYLRLEAVELSMELVSMSIFLLARYNVCARSIYMENKEDYEHRLWFARDTMIRGEIRNLFRVDSDPQFIYNLLDDFVEPILQTATLFSRICYEEDKKDKTPRIITV